MCHSRWVVAAFVSLAVAVVVRTASLDADNEQQRHASTDVAVPTDWSGTWHLTVATFDRRGDRLLSRVAFDDVIRHDDTIGLSIVRAPDRCRVVATRDRLELHCASDAADRLELAATRTGDTWHGSGEWTAGADGRRIAIDAARLSTDVARADSARTLAAKLLAESPLLDPRSGLMPIAEREPQS